jgi:MFS family permease
MNKELFKNKGFGFFISARLMFTIAILMQSVIIGWQVYEITKDAFSLGMVGLVEAIPSIATALISGVIVDSSDRKRVLLFAYILMFFCSTSLLIVSSDFIPALIGHKISIIYGIIFLTGISRGFYMPASQALLGQIVDKENYPYAVSWNITIWQIGAISGPAIGGFIYGFTGTLTSYIIIISFIAAAIIFVSGIKSKSAIKSTHQPIFERLTYGIKFVFSKQIILGSMTLDLFAVLFGGATALLPVFASDILDAGPKGLGILRAAPSIGAVIMAIYLTKHPPLKNTGKVLFSSVAGFGLSILLFAVSANFYLSVFALALSGMFDSVSVVIRQTILQIFTPDEMKGRVSAVNSIFIGSSNEIGAFESGLAAKLMGVVPSVIFGGIMTIMIVSSSIFLFPALRKMDMKEKELII